MKMKEEFEIVSYGTGNFKVFLVNLVYRTPHIHRDFEICFLLEGELKVQFRDESITFKAGDFWITNPFQSHELKALNTATILSIQIPPSFFRSYYPQIDSLEFEKTLQPSTVSNDVRAKLQEQILMIGFNYFDQNPYSMFFCAGLINNLFGLLLTYMPHKSVPIKEKEAAKSKAIRIKRISSYIEENYSKKLLLSDLAEQENLTLYYLSHFFKENFGMSFQDYLQRIRCEKARQLLLLTDSSLLDISLASGFSDSKYFNKSFKLYYGCTPKDYRKNFMNIPLQEQQKSMLTTQSFLSQKTSLALLNRLFEQYKDIWGK